MGIIVNDTLLNAATAAKRLILQWSEFDQRRYIRAQLGLNYDSFAQVFNGTTSFPSIWDVTIAPGKIAGTDLEPYRNLKLVDLDIRDIVSDTPINYFVFAMLKPGQTFAANTPSRFDIGIVNGVSFFQVSAMNIYAPHVEFLNCLFDNTHFKFPHFYQAKFRACTIENCIMDQGYWNADGSGSTRIDWSNVIIRKSDFMSSNMPRIRWLNCVIEDSTFSGADWRHFDSATDAITPLLFRCSFDSSQMNIRTGVSGKIEDCDFQNSIFSGPDSFSGYIQRNNFDNCQFQAVTFDYFCSFNSFRQTWFYVQPTFGVNCNMKGCDFTGSNLGTYFTKEQFRVAVPFLDESTIWVDGTPF
jgi:uncharacterized protein YjbI with pentapeptide repeats